MDVPSRYNQRWPRFDLNAARNWHTDPSGQALVQNPSNRNDVMSAERRAPVFFPAPTCLATTTDGSRVALEQVLGPVIVNRFPYVVALSLRRPSMFTEILERRGSAVLQFVPPGPATDQLAGVVGAVPADRSNERIDHAGLTVRSAVTNDAPVFDEAHLVYEASLAKPGRGFQREPIYEKPWVDVGDDRVYFLEINAIQLRRDIAQGHTQIHWRSLPQWRPTFKLQDPTRPSMHASDNGRYTKEYTPYYAFPSDGTTAFEEDTWQDGMAVKFIPPLPEDQVEVDNDRARWPCFFPSSLGMITTWAADGVPNLMPCGSTALVSQKPLVIATCVAYAAINERYAPRATLDIIRRTGRFGCGVPFIDDTVVGAIRYAGNNSISHDPHKVANAGLTVEASQTAPVLPALPVHYDCEVIGEVALGTHIMFLGEVSQIRVRRDVTPDNPIHWSPWANVATACAEQPAVAC